MNGYRPSYRDAPEPAQPLRPVVFVVDDDESILESLETLITCAGWQPRTFGSPQEFLENATVDGPSCLLLDMALPGLSGLELQERVVADLRGLPIVFITGGCDIPTTVRAMKAGAMEFLTKPYGEEEVLAAVRSALEHSGDALREQARSQALREAHESLTPREREVMALVVSGLLNKQVGGELGISEITVKAHRGKVMRKMKAGSLADLVRMVAELRKVL